MKRRVAVMEVLVASMAASPNTNSKMTTPDNAPVLGTNGISRPGIGPKIGNALLSVCRAAMAACATICLGILKEIAACVLWAVGFVVGVLVETIIDLRWILLTGLILMALLWFWMQNDPHRPRTRPYHADPAPGRIMR